MGQIIATTSITRPQYLLGKWLSNLTVLASLVGILAVAGLLIQLIFREAAQIQLWALIAPLLFIALPIVSVVVQSLYVSHEQILVEVENCQPFGGCTKELRVDSAATAALREDQPLGRFNGLGTYVNRAHLATSELGAILASQAGPGEKFAQILNLPFYGLHVCRHLHGQEASGLRIP